MRTISISTTAALTALSAMREHRNALARNLTAPAATLAVAYLTDDCDATIAELEGGKELFAEFSMLHLRGVPRHRALVPVAAN